MRDLFFSCSLTRFIFTEIENPSKEDIDKYHALYVSELTRIFDKYKCEAPGYENKELELE